jgi:superfamily II DNA or RNA helicase
LNRCRPRMNDFVMKEKKLVLKLRKSYGHFNFEPSLYDGKSFYYYRDGDIPLSNNQQIIMDRINRNKGDLLIPELVELVGEPDFPALYYTPDFSKPVKLTLKPVVNWSLGFLFDTFYKYDPLFTPVLYPNGDVDKSKAIPLTSDFFQNYHYYYSMDLKKGHVYMLERDHILGDLMKSFRNSDPFTMTEAQETLEGFSMQGLETVDRYPEFEFRELNSFPILEISQGKRSELHLILYFDYEGILLPFKNSEESIILQQSFDKIIYSRRDTIYEQAICSRCLITFGSKVHTKIFGAVRYYNFALSMEQQDFLVKYGNDLLDYGIQLKRKRDKKSILGSGGVSFRIKENTDWLDIEAVITSDEGEDVVELNLSLLDQNYAAGRKGLYIVDSKEIETLKTLYALGLGKNGILRTYRNNMGIINLIYASLINKEDETIKRLKELEEKISSVDLKEKRSKSPHFQGELRDYQQAGVNWLHFLHESGLNGCLADDMGLGKTIETLAFLQNLHDKNELERVLIVAPVSTLPNWEYEIDRFTPAFSTLQHSGSNRTSSINELEKPLVTLVSYQTLRNDIAQFKNVKYTYVILDEAQYIKNATTQAFKSVKILTSEHRLSLTGTPVENRTMDLWSQMDFLNPGLLGKADIFHKRFIIPIEENKDKEKTDQLRKIVYPFILRRKKSDVLAELPPRSEIIRYTDMASDQAALYNQLLRKYRGEIMDRVDEKGISGSSFDILQALMRLRQVVLFPGMLGQEYEKISSSKFDILKLHVKDITSEDHKILIFSQFVKSLTYIREWLEEEEIEYSYLDGSTRDRQSEIQAFQDDPNRKVFLISLKAGGTGINLTAADYVMIFDPWWNPAAEAQAIDRTHRIGQTRPVTAFRLIMRGTIEEKILDLQNRKKKLVDDLITTEESIFKEMSKDDLEELFKLA